jgi:hypothetical protein
MATNRLRLLETAGAGEGALPTGGGSGGSGATSDGMECSWVRPLLFLCRGREQEKSEARGHIAVGSSFIVRGTAAPGACCLPLPVGATALYLYRYTRENLFPVPISRFCFLFFGLMFFRPAAT